MLTTSARPSPALAKGFLHSVWYLRHLSAPDRAQVAHVFKRLREAAQSQALVETWREEASWLHQRVLEGTPYALIALGLRLVQAHTLLTLGRTGGSGRRTRQLLKEAFHLLRQEVRVLGGFREATDLPSLSFGKPPTRPWVARCDGSSRLERNAVGVTLQNPEGYVVATVALEAPPGNAVVAEIHAALTAMDTAICLGVRDLNIDTDALSVFRAFEQKLPLKYCLWEHALHERVQRFDALTLTLVPRLLTRHADELASTLF